MSPDEAQWTAQSTYGIDFEQTHHRVVRPEAAQRLFGTEGGVVYLCDRPDGFHIVVDESTLREFLDDEVIDYVSTSRFRSAADRQAYLTARDWPPPRRYGDLGFPPEQS